MSDIDAASPILHYARPQPGDPNEPMHRRVAILAFCASVPGPLLILLPAFALRLDRYVPDLVLTIGLPMLCIAFPLVTAFAGTRAALHLPPGRRGGGLGVAAGVIGCAWAVFTSLCLLAAA